MFEGVAVAVVTSLTTIFVLSLKSYLDARAERKKAQHLLESEDLGRKHESSMSLEEKLWKKVEAFEVAQEEWIDREKDWLKDRAIMLDEINQLHVEVGRMTIKLAALVEESRLLRESIEGVKTERDNLKAENGTLKEQLLGGMAG